MKKIILISILITVNVNCYSQFCDLTIKGIIDFDLPTGGYTGKAIHLSANVNIPDLSKYGIGVANNGNGGDGQEYTFPAISANDNDNILLVRDSSAISSYLGVCYQMFNLVIIASNAIDQNGNDAIELYCDSIVVETFGDINLNGTGTAWEYLDSWAYGSSDQIFNISNWTFGGVECTIGSLTTQSSSCPYPFCGSSNIENNSMNLSFNLFPNPSNEYIKIDTHYLSYYIQIFDELGKEIKSIEINNNIINIKNLPNGIYFLKLNSEEKTFSQKFIKY